MAGNLTTQVRNIATVTTAVARGDLSRKITVDVKGEILDLKYTINTMVGQLNGFASEVTAGENKAGNLSEKQIEFSRNINSTVIRPPANEISSSGADGPVTRGSTKLHTDAVNILIVDDEVRNLTVLETILDDPGYRLVRAESPDQALLALVSHEFALLILDVRMPGMTGFELAQMVRQRKKTEMVPIIFLTAYYNEDQDVMAAYGRGAVDYLHKPVNPFILRSKVAVFVDLYRKSLALQAANHALRAEVAERREAQTQLHELNRMLEERVLERTQQEKVRREQLQESEAFNRSLLEGTPDCVQVLDLAGRLLYVNGPGMTQMEIASPESWRDQYWWSLWPEAARQILHRSVEQALAGTAHSFTALRVMPNHVRKWWNVAVSPIRDAVDGKIVRILAVSRDVTQARETEETLRESDRDKDNFIATLAHELRNPLAPISNAVRVMHHLAPADTQLTWCGEVIERQVRQMSRLLEDLLDVSRITRSKLSLRRETIQVRDIIDHAMEIARPWIDRGGQSLEVALSDPVLVVSGDLTRLAQVVSNILINAVKYTAASGSIWLSAGDRRGRRS